MFTGMMVKPETAAFYKWYISEAVILCYLYKSILQILWMCKFPMIDNPCFL